jgi:hypothetical protein
MDRFRRPPCRRTQGVLGLPDHLLDRGQARTSRRQRTNRLVGSVRYDRGRRRGVLRGRSWARSPGRCARAIFVRRGLTGHLGAAERLAWTGSRSWPRSVAGRRNLVPDRDLNRPQHVMGGPHPTRNSPTAMRLSSATSAVRPDRPADGLPRPRILGLQRPEVSRPAGPTRNSPGRGLRDQDQFQESVFCPGERPVPMEFGEGCGRYGHRPEAAWR